MRKIFVLLVLGLLGGAYWYFMVYLAKPDPNKVYGNVDIHEVALAFDATGRIVDLKYREGEVIKKGEVLGEVDSSTIKLNIAAKTVALHVAQETLNKLQNGNRKQEIEASKANLMQAKAQHKLAKLTFDRKQSVYNNTNGKGISKAEVDEARAQLDVAIAAEASAAQQFNLMQEGTRQEDIALAKLQVQAVEREIAILQDQLTKTTLVTPQDGIIRTRLAEIGDMTSAQAPVYTILLNAQKWIRAYVDYQQLARVKHGMNLTIVFADNKQVQGKVGYISSVAEFTPKNVETEDLRTNLVYEIRIEADDPKDELRLGMPVTVLLPQEQKLATVPAK